MSVSKKKRMSMTEEGCKELSLKSFALLLSFLLFAFSGIIGLLISVVHVTIPAHYHGSIVGITIAIMGYVCLRVNDLFSKVDF